MREVTRKDEQLMTPSPEQDARCRDLLDALYDYVDGYCEESKRARLQEHVDECPHCLESLGIEQQVRELLKKRCCEPAPQGLRTRIISELHVRYINVRRE